MKNVFVFSGWVAATALVFSGCSHAPPAQKGALRAKYAPLALLNLACAPGLGTKHVSGVAWMKAKSPDASGQFPASIDARSAGGGKPASLKLEVQQPFGGTAAILTVQGAELRIEVPGKPERGRRERDSWAGIPLRWATELFLGRIPCPDADRAAKSSVSINDDDELIVALPADSSGRTSRFVYRFEQKKDREWPTALHWESGSAVVDFEFDDPESPSMSPKKWEAKSKQGEVKIRWRDREIER